MIPIEDLTDVTLAIEDTDEDDADDEEDLTDVTLVRDDTYWKTVEDADDNNLKGVSNLIIRPWFNQLRLGVYSRVLKVTIITIWWADSLTLLWHQIY